MSRIKASTSSIYDCGVKLQEGAQEYLDNYTAIKNLVKDLGACWQGKDYDVFLKNVEALDSSWNQMFNLLNGAGDALKTSASRYDDACARICTSASRI